MHVHMNIRTYTYMYIDSSLVVPENPVFGNSQKSPTTEFT